MCLQLEERAMFSRVLLTRGSVCHAGQVWRGLSAQQRGLLDPGALWLSEGSTSRVRLRGSSPLQRDISCLSRLPPCSPPSLLSFLSSSLP